MTVLQAGWSHLIENKRARAALLLLMDQAKRVPEKHYAELLEMVQATFDLETRSAA